MCFIKNSTPAVQPIEETVQRHQADADVTKNSQNNTAKGGFNQNLKTTPFGLEDTTQTNKKTLLGE